MMLWNLTEKTDRYGVNFEQGTENCVIAHRRLRRSFSILQSWSGFIHITRIHIYVARKMDHYLADRRQIWPTRVFGQTDYQTS